MAKTNHSYNKRKRELENKKKQEEKFNKRQEKKLDKKRSDASEGQAESTTKDS